MSYPPLGLGLGLRANYFQTIIETWPSVDWFEMLTENFLEPNGRHHYFLEKIAERYPLVMHGVALSIGSSDPLNLGYLRRVKDLASRYAVRWVSDHLCWTGVDGVNIHDLMPLPFTSDVVKYLVERIQRVQDFLGQQILLENLSSYVTYQQSAMTEWAFIAEIAERADCLLLLDINNVYVSACNHHFDPLTYLDAMPPKRVQQFHLAGHSQGQYGLIDSHDAPICPPVLELYRHALKRFGQVSTMIERDDNFPPFSDLMAELSQVRQLVATVFETHYEAMLP